VAGLGQGREGEQLQGETNDEQAVHVQRDSFRESLPGASGWDVDIIVL
jgi:hypothetical protein